MKWMCEMVYRFLSTTKRLVTGIFLSGVVFGIAHGAHALPFNDDMVHDQYSVGEVLRAEPPLSIPLGSGKFAPISREEVTLWKNPVARTAESVARGGGL